MANNFALFRMEVIVVVPHDLFRLVGADLAEDIARGVGQGHLPAEIEVNLAAEKVSLADVPEYLLQVWLTRLAADSAALAAARKALEDLPSNDDGRIEEVFYAWDVGTPLVEIKQWFKENK